KARPGKGAGKASRMKNSDQYAGIFWLLLGGGITVSSFFYGVGSFSAPGPGFITFLAGAILTFLSLLLLISASKDKAGGPGLRKLWEGRQTGKAFYIMGLLVAYMLLISPMGFMLSTFFLLILLFRVQAAYSRLKLITLSAGATFASIVVFDLWLGVQLPRGFLGYILF
ncbi:MAG TPA: tripartite tricarboxylate transporter TctB family protein, partial [Thermodesulfobacteriota bacterium]|nr:tripartite tricarboxylate transporter TctB family protein [Thermodesulfobacteriota bacterium]